MALELGSTESLFDKPGATSANLERFCNCHNSFFFLISSPEHILTWSSLWSELFLHQRKQNPSEQQLSVRFTTLQFSFPAVGLCHFSTNTNFKQCHSPKLGPKNRVKNVFIGESHGLPGVWGAQSKSFFLLKIKILTFCWLTLLPVGQNKHSNQGFFCCFLIERDTNFCPRKNNRTQELITRLNWRAHNYCSWFWLQIFVITFFSKTKRLFSKGVPGRSPWDKQRFRQKPPKISKSDSK